MALFIIISPAVKVIEEDDTVMVEHEGSKDRLVSVFNRKWATLEPNIKEGSSNVP